MNIKKIISAMLILSMLSGISVYAEGISVFVNNTKLTFDAEPFIQNDRTLVPMRAIFEALGASVAWDDETKTVFALRQNDDGTKNIISVQANETKAFVNSKEYTLDVPVQIVNDRTFVPLRFVSESLGNNVEWDGSTQTITITD